jgi:hypothetical protein
MLWAWFSGMNYRQFLKQSDFYFLSNAGYYRLTAGNGIEIGGI